LKVFSIYQDKKLGKDISSILDDIILQAKIAETDQDQQQITQHQYKMKCLEDFIAYKNIDVVDCTLALDVLTSLGEDSLVLANFTALMLVKDQKSRKMAMKIKTDHFDQEVFPLVLYYIIADSKANEKKLVPNLHDCLLQAFNQANRLTLQIEDEQGQSQRDPTALMAYQQEKGKDFSLFFTNAYLYFKIYRFLSVRDINSLAVVFLDAARQDLSSNLASKSKSELMELPLSEYTLLWKILHYSNSYQELQDILIRWIIIRSGNTYTDRIIALHFITNANKMTDKMYVHFLEVANYIGSSLPGGTEDLEGQKKITNYVVKITDTGKFEPFLENHEEFEKFSKQVFAHEITKKVCPTYFYGKYFPENELGCMSDKQLKLQSTYFDDFVGYQLKAWIEAVESKSSLAEVTVKEPLGIKNLTDDFFSVCNSNGSIGDNILDEKRISSIEAPKFTLKSALDNKHEFITAFSVHSFCSYVRKEKNFKIFTKEEVLIDLKRDIAPDYLRSEDIRVFQGCLSVNQQRCCVIHVSVRTIEHMRRIRENLDLMNMYSPLVIKYLGIILDQEASTSSIELYFVTDYWEETLYDWVQKRTDPKAKETSLQMITLAYRCISFVNSCLKTELPVPLLTPFHIFMSQNDYPLFLLPFFASSFLSLQDHLGKSFQYSTHPSTPQHYFLYPFYDGLANAGTVIHLMHSTGNYRFSKLVANSEYWGTMESMANYSLTRLVFFILTNEVPGIQAKTINVGALLQLMQNEMKTLPNLKKQFTVAKKKLPAQFKYLMDTLSGSLQRGSPANWQAMLSQLRGLLPSAPIETDVVKFNLSIVSAATYLDDNSTLQGPVRRVVYLPMKLVFNGYLGGKDFMEAVRFYYGNNLLTTFIPLDDPSHFTADFFIDESKTLLLKFTKNQLEDITLFSKHHVGQKSGNEGSMNIGKFFENSWVPTEQFWVNSLSPFTKSDPDDLRVRMLKSDPSFQRSTLASLNESERTSATADTHNQVFFSYLKLPVAKIFSNEYFTDLFGNIVYSDETDSSIADTRFAIKPLCPLELTYTYFYYKAVSQYSFFSTNLAEFTLRAFRQPMETYLDFIYSKLSLTRYNCISTYLDGGQFWGESIERKPLQGKLYTNDNDYNTISERDAYQGQFCVTSKNFRYEGFLLNSLPHYYGKYFLNNFLVYSGEITKEVPEGKGKVYSESGQLLFDGILHEGLPSRGIFYRLPRIYVGKFTIPNKSLYKFNYRQLDLFVKTLKYDTMLSSFSLDGEVSNYAPDVQIAKGFFSHDQPGLNGEFFIKSKEGKAYIGEMVDSKKAGLGLMLLSNGHMMIGRWIGNTFQGVYKCSTKESNQKADSSSPQKLGDSGLMKKGTSWNHESMSRFESVRRASTFNKNPVEVTGFFNVVGDTLVLVDYGIIKFEDGSVYSGEISNNKMSGYGNLKYATGEYYEGRWKQNHMSGLGQYTGDNYVYEGQFKYGLWHGFGILRLQDESRIVKGEWDRGKLKYALIDETPSNSNYLQVERMIVSIADEGHFWKTGKIELIGTSQVVFKDRSRHSNREIPGEETLAQASSPKGNPPLQFFGTFKRLDSDQFDDFTKGQVIGIGYIIKGTDVVFKGMVDQEFSKFFGVKYDHETETEYTGYFNSNFKLNGPGQANTGESIYTGTFKKNLKSGLIIKKKGGKDMLIGEYTDDKKNGYALKRTGDEMILTEFAFGKLKRIFYKN
jgi:hypothetical protein